MGRLCKVPCIYTLMFHGGSSGVVQRDEKPAASAAESSSQSQNGGKDRWGLSSLNDDKDKAKSKDSDDGESPTCASRCFTCVG